VNVAPGFDGLNNSPDLTSILGYRVSYREILERELVPERDRLFGTSLEGLVVS
jgi:hypothetical protein